MRYLSIVFLAFLTSGAFARDFQAQEIESTDGMIKCNSYRDWYITAITGPCSDFKPPARIAIGEKFSERGISHLIKIIAATQVDKDMNFDDVHIRKGDWYCVAAESSSDLDMDGSEGRRTWLYIPRCRPIR